MGWLGRTPYASGFGLLPGLSKRTATTQRPGMALPFSPHPPRIRRAVRCTLSIWRTPRSAAGVVREADRLASSSVLPCVGFVPFLASPMLSPCVCHGREAWLSSLLRCAQAACFHTHKPSPWEAESMSHGDLRVPCVYKHLRGIPQAETPSSLHFDVPMTRSQEHFRVLRSLDGIAKPAPDAVPGDS
jgi:hypothetical protein